jgi:prepilin-type N-terminal cleavage/methylation domain-containing protein
MFTQVKYRIQIIKANTGYTLPETIIALAIWSILALAAIHTLLYVTRVSVSALDMQDAFGHARAALDTLIVNVQMADTILLETDHEGILKKLTLTERNPSGQPANYIFYFKRTAEPGEAKYQRLEFGLNAEFAARIAYVRLKPAGEGRLGITVAAAVSGLPLVLYASADTRYKNVTIIKD